MYTSRSVRLAALGGLLIGLFSVKSNAEPVVPGFDHLGAGKDAASQALAGEVLLGELNCVACHQADEVSIRRLSPKSAPDLSAVGVQVTPSYLREFLFRTHQAKPGTAMPDLFHGAGAQQREEEVEELIHFLVSRSAGPIAPSKLGGNERLVERGRELYHSAGCVACHAPEKDAEKLKSPVVPLGNLASKTTVDQLSAFLLDPLKVRKSGRMPNLWLGESEARAIAVYLLRDQLKAANRKAGSTAAAPAEIGVAWQYFEAPMGDKLPDFEALTPTKTGTHGTITFNMGFDKARQNFAMRWRATLRIPEDGTWTFFTVSDDGSSLHIDGELVVANDGVHDRKEVSGSMELKAGDHEFEVRYFQKVNRAVFGVGWQGPKHRKQRIPSSALFVPRGNPMVPLGMGEKAFVVDRAKAEAGARHFTSKACVSCHEMKGTDPAPPLKPLAGLVAGAAGGCLSEEPGENAPDFDLSPGQRKALLAALENRVSLKQPLSASHRVHRTLASLNCYACHERDGLGGPDEARREHFKTRVAIDLGEEGKIPPNLNSAGSKLRREALEKILYHGEFHVRGRYMATRMPGFGKENLEPLVSALIESDARPKDGEAPEFNYGSARDGQALAGTSGLACITCHNVGGRDATGIPGIDLAEMHQRLNPGWFQRFLRDPQSFNKDTRMPGFWPGGVAAFKQIADGETTKQIEGLWNYLSLGKSMPPPPGVAQVGGGAGSELKPALEPIVHRTFMTDVGPRAIVAGFPERLHVAFDANVIRLAKAWRGRFFDASGVASGRSDKFFGPLGEDVLDMPPGPALAILKSPGDPWPEAGKLDRDVGGEFSGYLLSPSGAPIFSYRLGGVDIQEEPVPEMKPGGAILVRRFHLSATEGAETEGLSFLAASGKEIESRGDGRWIVDKKVEVRIVSKSGLKPAVRQGGGGRELIVPLLIKPGEKLEFEVEIQW